ncbi:MAG: glycogen/starch synthase, partial [Candidatus Omnitrophica bacterium]|nr:glycogen/starch synthase [Candidatus Omnitrophota bacterium]
MAQIKRISVEKEKGSNVIKRNDLKPLNILIAASEAVPFIKTGGMGDVCGALSKALKRQGHDVRLVLPRYWDINPEKWGTKTLLAPMGVQMGD